MDIVSFVYSTPRQPWKSITLLFVITTCIILLQPVMINSNNFGIDCNIKEYHEMHAWIETAWYVLDVATNSTRTEYIASQYKGIFSEIRVFDNMFPKKLYASGFSIEKTASLCGLWSHVVLLCRWWILWFINNIIDTEIHHLPGLFLSSYSHFSYVMGPFV